MREKILNIKSIELFVFAVIWMVIFTIPFFNQRVDNTVDWSRIAGEWMSMFLFLIIFLLNTLFLVPKFLFQKKYRTYILLALFSILTLIGITISLRFLIAPAQPLGMPPMDLGPGMPPMELGPGMPPPMGYNPVLPAEPKPVYLVFRDNLFLAILVVGMDTAGKMATNGTVE